MLGLWTQLGARLGAALWPLLRTLRCGVPWALLRLLFVYSVAFVHGVLSGWLTVISGWVIVLVFILGITGLLVLRWCLG